MFHISIIYRSAQITPNNYFACICKILRYYYNYITIYYYKYYHIIIVKQSEALKIFNYQFGYKANSSTLLCSTMVNGTLQYYSENILCSILQNQYVFYYLMPRKHSITLRLMSYSMNYVIVLCVLRLQSYYNTGVQMKGVA